MAEERAFIKRKYAAQLHEELTGVIFNGYVSNTAHALMRQIDEELAAVA